MYNDDTLYIITPQLNESSISWQYLVALYERDTGKATGLAMVPKLKFEHIHLSSFAKMRVDLAAQVCDYVHL